MAYTLPSLPYPANALEPYIDAETMELHHGKHHATYVKNLNAALEKYPKLVSTSIEELLTVADGGGIMPPKSTWFEPKLRDAMFCHMLTSN